MTIQEFIKNYLAQRLEKSRCLVVYDPDRRYADIVQDMKTDSCTFIDSSVSTILGREAAMDAWLNLTGTDGHDRKLIIYLPINKPRTDKEKQQNPYELFALGGGAFPEGDGESYLALCHQAAPEQTELIDSLFADEIPDFDTINNLIKGKSNWPKLKTLLNAESALEILTSVLSPSRVQEKTLQEDDTWVLEFRKFLKGTLDLELKTRSKKWSSISDEVWRFVLFSEFVFDLPGELPDSLKDVPKAPSSLKGLIYSLCDNLRSSENHQMRYREMAEKVSADLQLVKQMAGITNLGIRDTFPFEEKIYLSVFTDAALAGNYEVANDISSIRKNSIWVKQFPERQQLWTLADRALQLITRVEDIKDPIDKLKSKADELFDFYCSLFREVDRLHREFEQSVTDAYGGLDALESLVETVRKKYLKTAELLQSKFIEAIKKEGWPISERIRNTEVFPKFIASFLEQRKKVAFFMIDALRYELAVELEKELSSKFQVSVTPVCAQLPTITRVGMASLMPEAENNLRLVKEKDTLIPYIRDQRIIDPDDRFEYVRKFYGDRCHMRDLYELNKPKIKIPETTQLLLIKTTDIDKLGEAMPHEASRILPQLLQKIIAGIYQVQKRGFDRAVLATDHGFVLFDEQSFGDDVPKPTGEWILEKNRCLLGKGSSGPGVIVFNKSEVGIEGDFEDYAVPRTFGTFVKGNTYFHDGLSLQECVLPVLTVEFTKETTDIVKSDIEIRLSYKGGSTDKVTTRRPMIELVMHKTDFFYDKEIEIKLEAYSKSGLVGEAAACPYVNAATGLISIQPGQAIKVPLKMAEDFHGIFEVRAMDPVTNVNYSTLKLKTDYVD